MSKGWDNATLKKLKALTGKGLSTAEIGKRLGMSKNAVVGKLNRLGWNSKAGGAPAAEKPAPKKAAEKNTAPKKTAAKTPAKKGATPKTAPAKKVATTPKKAAPAPKAKPQAPDRKSTRQTSTRTKTGAGGKNIRPRWQIIEQESGHAPADYSTFPGNGEFKAEPMPLAHWRPRFRRFPFLWGYGLCGQTVLL